MPNAIARSRPEQWKEYYGPASRCCDRMTSSLQLDRESSGQDVKVNTSWLDDGDGKLPEGLTALFDSVWSATDMCAFR